MTDPCDFMMQNEKDFWKIVENKFAAVDMTVKLILSANGFRNYLSFKGVEANDSLLDTMTARIKNLGQDTKYYKALKELTQEDPASFEMHAGFSSNIRNLFIVVNGIDNFPLKVDENIETESKRGVKRQHSGPSPPSNKQPKIAVSHADNERNLKKKIIEIIKIANPSLDIENVIIPLTHSKTTDKILAYNTECFVCKDPAQVSINLLNSGYYQYRVDVYCKHIERKHPIEGQRLKEFKAKKGSKNNEISSNEVVLAEEPVSQDQEEIVFQQI